MDLLAALLNYLSPSVKYFYSGASCATGIYDGKDPFGHMHLIKSGSMEVHIGEQHCLSINTPTVLFFPQPCAHIMIPNAGAVELVCGKVDLGISQQSPLAISMPEFLVIPIIEMPAIGATLDLLYQEAFTEGIGRQTALDRLLEYFLIHVLRHLISQGQISRGALAAMSDPRIALAINAMHERPSYTWTLDKLADRAGMSRARFAANFHKLAGLPPLEYLTSWRLSVARGMLRQGRPLKSVAFAVGYQSPEAFGRVFAKKIGQSPSEWLRAQFSSTEVVN
jgi:AraC-like DNA-binding protein